MPYSMRCKAISEWYTQLMAESLGKRCNHTGHIIYYGRTPVVAVGTTDMHAQTQQHQDGRRNKIVQFLEILELERTIEIKKSFEECQLLDKYYGISMDFALKIALKSNEEALAGDNRPSAKYVLPKLNEYYLGHLLYFLMLSVAYEGEFADVDTYNQPGVEAYKKIMKSKLFI
jgi:glucose-6-phosphate isomerase